MLFHLTDCDSALHVSVQHGFDEINAILAHYPRNPQLMIQNFVNAVEGVLFVNKRVEEDAESPDVLFFAPIRLALQHFRSGVICQETCISTCQQRRLGLEDSCG